MIRKIADFVAKRSVNKVRVFSRNPENRAMLEKCVKMVIMRTDITKALHELMMNDEEKYTSIIRISADELLYATAHRKIDISNVENHYKFIDDRVELFKQNI